MKSLTISFFATVTLLLFCSSVEAYTMSECVDCHGKDSTISTKQISIDEFTASVHAKQVPCQGCHAGIKDQEHQAMKGSGRVDCGLCHKEPNRHGFNGADDRRPQCYSCHTKHHILPEQNEASSVHPGRLRETCQGCHPVECGKRDLLSWLPSITVASHNKQDFSQVYRRDNCLGCHQGQAAHGEEKRLNDQTCDRCHLPLGRHAALLGYIHLKADPRKQPGSFIAGMIYPVSLCFLIGVAVRYLLNRS